MEDTVEVSPPKSGTFYEFWSQFDDQYLERATDRAPSSFPIDLSPYLEAVNLRSSSPDDLADSPAERWEAAKAISKLAMPKVKTVCEQANEGNLEAHKCPSDAVCELLASEDLERQVPYLAAALLIPQDNQALGRWGSLQNSAKRIALRAQAPYFVVYHWLKS